MDATYEIKFRGATFKAKRFSHYWYILSAIHSITIVSLQEIHGDQVLQKEPCHLRSATDGNLHVLYRGKFTIGNLEGGETAVAQIHGSYKLIAAEVLHIHYHILNRLKSLEGESGALNSQSDLAAPYEEIENDLQDDYDLAIGESENMSFWAEIGVEKESNNNGKIKENLCEWELVE